MKRLRDFQYHEPSTVVEAVEVLAGAGPDAAVIAGGTDLVVDMKLGRMRPATVVNLKGISGLASIEDVGDGTQVGALTKVTAIQDSDLVGRRHPALAQAASILASPPVRALATIGGNVGRASPASDLGPALIVSSAMARIHGPDGVRDEAVEDLFVGPGSTTLTHADVITSFFLPAPPAGFGSAHVKLGKRGSGTDIALAGASASMTVGIDGTIKDARVALNSLGPKPMRSHRAEQALLGNPVTGQVLASSAAAARDDATPISDMRASAEYRTALAYVLTLRALRQAAGEDAVT